MAITITIITAAAIITVVATLKDTTIIHVLLVAFKDAIVTKKTVIDPLGREAIITI